jgi:predicted DNA-binding transcriptional regulator AlpA
VEVDVGVTVGQTRRLTLRDAAQVLGISKEAVRKRVKRGTLPSYVGEDGRRYVYLDAGGDAGPHRRVPGAVPGTYDDPRDELIATLKEQLEAERNAHAETRRITYTLAQRVPELEPPREEPRAPETVAEEPDGTETPSERSWADRESEAGVQGRSWWRRFFGFE